jgi:hypothetical protein
MVARTVGARYIHLQRFLKPSKSGEIAKPPKGGGIFKAAEKAALQGRTTS